MPDPSPKHCKGEVPEGEQVRWSEQWTLGSDTSPKVITSTVALSGPAIYHEQEVEVVPKLEAEQRIETAEATGKQRLLDEHEARVAAEAEAEKAEERLKEVERQRDNANAALEEAEQRAHRWKDEAQRAGAEADKAEAALADRDRQVRELRDALAFYADPDTYFAIGFAGDSPCGEFLEDLEEIGGAPRPGKRARAALTQPSSAPLQQDRRYTKPIIQPGEEWKAATAVIGAEIDDPAGYAASDLLHRTIDAVEAVRYRDVKPRPIVDRPEA
jgi:hypothetical protein